MTDKEYELNETIDSSILDVEKAIFMLNEFIDSYIWAIKPTPEKAIKYGSSTKFDSLTKDEEISYRLLAEYDRMTNLIQIARDYCYNASQTLNSKEG